MLGFGTGNGLVRKLQHHVGGLEDKKNEIFLSREKDHPEWCEGLLIQMSTTQTG